LVFFARAAAIIDDRILRELKNIRAEKGETGFDRGLQGARRRHHANHGKHADRDAEHRERRAELVRPERGKRKLDGFLEGHGYLARRVIRCWLARDQDLEGGHWLEAIPNN